jgi:hypothetical protein
MEETKLLYWGADFVYNMLLKEVLKSGGQF